jgi:hypothetical protein
MPDKSQSRFEFEPVCLLLWSAKEARRGDKEKTTRGSKKQDESNGRL